jgi:urease accessory protein
MIIEKVIGNIYKDLIRSSHVEKVYLNSEDLLKRIQRVKTDHGKELGIRLDGHTDLEDGDVLYKDEKNMIVIYTNKDNVITIKPRTILEMGEIAHQLGNRHLPAQFEGDEMIVQYDYLVEELLSQLGIPFEREERKMKKAFRHIGH